MKWPFGFSIIKAKLMDLSCPGMRGNSRQKHKYQQREGQKEKRESIKKIMKIKHRPLVIVIRVSREACNELKQYGCFV